MLVNGSTYSRPFRLNRISPGKRPIPRRLSHGCSAVSTSSAMKVVNSHFIAEVYAAARSPLKRMQTITARESDHGSVNSSPDHQDFDQLAHFGLGHEPVQRRRVASRVFCLQLIEHAAIQ